jgi:SAM-dependent methyltransferase
VEIHDAKAWDTGLPAGCADIVTFSQSLHHMPPEPTLREAARLLRPGGVLAAYDHLMPPAISWEVEGVLEVFLERVEAMRRKRSEGREATWWPKAEHVRRLRECGHFRQVRRFALHHRELGNRERLLGLVSSLSAVRALREDGVSEEEIGLPALRDALQPLLDDSLQAWFFDYRVVVGLRGEE